MESFDLRKWAGFTLAGGSHDFPAIIDQITIDTRRVYTRNSLFVALKGERTDGHQYLKTAAENGVKYALVSRLFHSDLQFEGLKLLKVDDPLTALQEIAGTYRSQYHCKVIAITGSYGKTMVKDLLSALLESSNCVISSPESFNSQIGVSLSLLRILPHHEIAIIEAGISKVGEMDRLREMILPDHVILTHVGGKYRQSLASLDITASEMGKLTHRLPVNNWVMMPDTRECHQQAAIGHLKNYHYWNSYTSDLPFAQRKQNNQTTEHPYEVIFPDGRTFQGCIKTGHAYFLDLVNIAIKAAWLLNCTSENIENILKNYIPEPMRTEMWETTSGGSIINEPYCADPQSVDLALRRFEKTHPEGKKVFIFGGIRGNELHLENDYSRIGKAISKCNLDHLLLVGNHAFDSLKKEVQKHSPQTSIAEYENCTQAFGYIKSKLNKNDSVLVKGSHKQTLDDINRTFEGSIRTNQCFINLAAIVTNIGIIRRMVGVGTRIMPIIKAEAYGTNSITMAKFFEAEGIDILGVSYVDEGVALKRAGVSQDVFAINAAIYEAEKAVNWGLEVGVSDISLAESLSKEAKKQDKIIKVHLHVDTGMSRLGCRAEEALALAKEISRLPNLKLEGVWTHFACADEQDEDTFTAQQISLFDRVIAEIESEGMNLPWKHASNSSGAMRFSLPQYNMVRIGLSLYGLSASQSAKQSQELKLALSLQSRIVGINICKKGETVSYGRNYIVDKSEQRIAVIPVGYFDGIHRHYSGKGSVMVHGVKAPMIGNICMDYLMVDVTNIPHATIGDSVLIFGEDDYGNYLPPELLANQGNSIVHELISCLGPRIQRVFIHEENASSC